MTKSPKTNLLREKCLKISFLRFSQKVSILSYMLLHNININMAFTNNLHHQKSLYDHQGLRYKNSDTLLHWKTLNGPGPSSEFQTLNHVSWILQLFRTTLALFLTGIIDAISKEIDYFKKLFWLEMKEYVWPFLLGLLSK